MGLMGFAISNRNLFDDFVFLFYFFSYLQSITLICSIWGDTMQAKTLAPQFLNQAKRTMESVSCCNGENLGSFERCGEVALRLWDMDPNTSTVRWLVRNKIVEFLSEHPIFRELEQEKREKIARSIDEILLAKAPSQVHYMNLETLKSRLIDLLSNFQNFGATKNLHCDISFSSNGSVAQCGEMSYNIKPSTPDSSYHDVSTSSGDSSAVSSVTAVNKNSASSLLLDGGSTASRRYLPNGHHRVVANASFDPDGNAMHCPETTVQSLPKVSKNYRDDRLSTEMPPNTHVRYCDSHALDDAGCNRQFSTSQMANARIPDEYFYGGQSFAMNTDKTIGAAPFERCNNHLIPDAKLIMPSPFGSSGNFKNMRQPGIQSSLGMKSADAPSSGFKMGQFLQPIQLEQFEPSSQRPILLYNQPDDCDENQQNEEYSHQQHFWVSNRISGLNHSQSILSVSNRVEDCIVQNDPHRQSDQPQLQQKEHYSQQHYLSVENRIPEWSQAQRILSADGQAKGCIIPNQMPMKSRMVQNVTQQFPTSIQGSKRDLSESSAAADKFGAPRSEAQNIRKFLLLYHHALCCSGHERKCRYPGCMDMKLFFDHRPICSVGCKQKFCSLFKKMLAHYQDCCDNTCGICVSIKMDVESNLQGTFDLDNSLQGTLTSSITKTIASPPTTVNTIVHEQPSSKRTKTEDPFLFHTSQNETSKVSLPVIDEVLSYPEGNTHGCQELNTPVNTASESTELDIEPSSGSTQESNVVCCKIKTGDPVVDIKMNLPFESSPTLELTDNQPEKENVKVPAEEDKAKLESNCMIPLTSEVHEMESKSLKLKKGVSLIDSFTREKILEHINSLTQFVGQTKEKAEENQGMGHTKDENTCSLCGVQNLRFDPPARYCAVCTNRINPKGVYYFTTSIANGSDSEAFFCRNCVNLSGENVNVGDKSILKANLGRGENYADTDELNEWWVQCDKCEAWQHQICSLFNPIRNDVVEANYTCPTCILQEIESGEHHPLLQSKIPGAKDLQRTMLSNHLEKWVFRRLEEERQQRASSLGKNFSEVPTAEGLVIRVVSSVVKQIEVKQVFRDIFQEEAYPSEFPYKSKAIILFQNIDGVDVCLFGMYVQEYGSRCADPNKRRLCISYVDSVKHFRPTVTTVTGEALRTFVYHEILNGYLDYCKKRGFTSCYIWACPPLKRDDDYILYCHPKIQKMPKPDKLREWYQTLIRKAAKAGIVVEHTNLYDHFFVNNSDCKAKVTAARLPYFDSDYWPGQAEVLLQSKGKSKPQKKGRNAGTERVLRAFRRDSVMGNPKDILLMYQLGDVLRPSKEDFILVHLWHVCKHCCHPILSGDQWACCVCKNFLLCEKCFLSEQNLLTKDKHPTGKSENHSFQKIQGDNIPANTTDDDETVQNEIFDTRLMFLGHCQNNRYQFDTLRRAKHSTMMILHNLHNPFPPVLVSACTGCQNGLPAAEGWQCSSCTGYGLCDSCHQKGEFLHEHELICRAKVTDHNLQPCNKNKQVQSLQLTMTSHNLQQSNQNKQVQSLQDLSGALLSHTTKCRASGCTYPYCRKLKELFHHCANCQIRVNGGCEHCRKIWFILHHHAQSCGDQECHAPRCKDLKEHLRKNRLLEDSRRRAGAKERMRVRIKRQNIS